ncbi:hypothetical protein C0992_002759, partial [Termitomyces sp. T32_za158]
MCNIDSQLDTQTYDFLHSFGLKRRSIFAGLEDGCRTRKIRSPAPTIRTLDPEHLQIGDFVDFSGLKGRTICAGLKNGRQIGGKIYYNHKRSSFPLNTQGFLYYHQYPHLPPTTGEIRFRVTKSSDPSYFRNGTDLMAFDGVLPWSIPPFRLLVSHAPLKELLAQDYNIPAEILNFKTQDFPIFLHYLEKPFVLKLEQSATSINVIDSELSIDKTKVLTLLPMPGNNKRSVYR